MDHIRPKDPCRMAAITTSLKTSYAWRAIIIAIVCGVLGVWGIYDYAYKIPWQTEAVRRAEVCREFQEIMEISGASRMEFEARNRELAATLGEEMDRVIATGVPPLSGDPGEQVRLNVSPDDVTSSEGEGWRDIVFLFAAAAAQPRVPGDPLADLPKQMHQIARHGVDQLGGVTKPSAFDRYVQWAFILCLPFVPFYLWTLISARKRTHRLDEDGTLHTPEGSWASDEIADVDMSRWMSKSVAEVVHTDGRRAKLDDYVYRNADRIVGHFAHRFHPEQWNEDATPVKADTEAAEAAPKAEGDEGSLG